MYPPATEARWRFGCKISCDGMSSLEKGALELAGRGAMAARWRLAAAEREGDDAALLVSAVLHALRDASALEVPAGEGSGRGAMEANRH